MESAIEDVVSPCQIVADWTSTKESADNTVTLRLSPVKHAYDGEAELLLLNVPKLERNDSQFPL